MGGEGPEIATGAGGPAAGGKVSALPSLRNGPALQANLLRLLVDWLVLLPFLVIVGPLLAGPLLGMLIDSVRGPDGTVTLQNWQDALGQPITKRAIIASLWLGALVATATMFVGTPLAWCISRLALRGRSLATAALNLAANIPATSLAFGFTATFGASGLVTLTLQALWPWLIAPSIYSLPGLVAAYLYFQIPLFVLLVLPGMGAIGTDLWEAAAVCGASPARFWRRVGLPVLAPFLLAGWMLMFVSAIGAYALPLALAGTDGRVELITLRIGDLVQTAGTTNRFERAACLSILLIVLTAATLALHHRLLRAVARKPGLT